MNRSVVLVASLLCALPGGWLASLAWTLTTPVRVAMVLTGALVGAALATLAVTDPPAARHGPAQRADPRAQMPGRRQPAGPVGPYPAEAEGTDGAERAALIAQCPRCGELRLDSGRQGPAYRFRCGNPGCGHAWTWHPDEPWPPIVVRRNLPAGPTYPR